MPTSSDSRPRNSTAARPEPLLAVRGLSAGYGAAPVVTGADLEVGAGEVVSVIGANGAGKSTLLKALTGRLEATAGSVSFSGRDVTNQPGHVLARLGLGYVPQVRDVFETLTVAENLQMGGYLLPRTDVPARIDAVAATFPALRGMWSRTASKLSGGERKMLAVARALMLAPSLIILDEPTSNLSAPLSRSVLREVVRRLADGGAAVLLVEQKAFEALGVSDWAYVMVAGRIEITGPAGQILARPDIREVFLGRPASRGAAEHG